jgi:hypothetical protein
MKATRDSAQRALWRQVHPRGLYPTSSSLSTEREDYLCRYYGRLQRLRSTFMNNPSLRYLKGELFSFFTERRDCLHRYYGSVQRLRSTVMNNPSLSRPIGELSIAIPVERDYEDRNLTRPLWNDALVGDVLRTMPNLRSLRLTSMCSGLFQEEWLSLWPYERSEADKAVQNCPGAVN